MAWARFWPGVGLTRGDPVHVQQVSNAIRLFAILNRERLYAAYAIGDLDPVLFPDTRWYVAEEDGTSALGLLFTGLSFPIIFTMGDADGVAAILAQSLRPATAYFNCRAEHLPAVTHYYQLDERHKMWRMALTAKTFRPHEAQDRPVRLHSKDLNALNALYEMAEAQAFAAYQVEQGVFYGLHMSGELVATAGTHVVSPAYEIAAVGNVFTHPAHRGHGYATACTSAVVRDLLQLGCRDVVLNVNVRNDVAISVYERLGFHCHCRYFEGLGKRRQQGLLARLWGGDEGP